MSKVLFICKYRHGYGPHHHLSSGLRNSARLVSEMLDDHGIPSQVVEVADYNGIDKVVTQYRPTHVIVEAIWVIPEKFQELHRLHPSVHWNVRIHSNLPFLAGEGKALDWLLKYPDYRRVSIGTNSLRARDDLIFMLNELQGNPFEVESKVVYLPNYYEMLPRKPLPWKSSKILNVGCFGAIRPLKNHLVQAVGAMEYAVSVGKVLRFHINVGREEMGGNPSLQSLRALFSEIHDHALVEHPWLAHDDFLKLVKVMDVGLQVSLSETFNIITADFVSCSIPTVASPEVHWLHPMFQADPNSARDIASKIGLALKYGSDASRIRLAAYNAVSKDMWLGYLNA